MKVNGKMINLMVMYLSYYQDLECIDLIVGLFLKEDSLMDS